MAIQSNHSEEVQKKGCYMANLVERPLMLSTGRERR